jgi:sugar lactone lactonase YvrE
VISTVAGTGAQGFSGDGGAATSAQLDSPYGVAVDGSGNLFIADLSNSRVRKVVLSTGVISTVAGTGAPGLSGDGGAATSAQLSSPYGVAVDGSGNLFIADRGNSRVRKVLSTGVISTVAGTWPAGFSGDGGAATSAQLKYPEGVAVDGSGNLFIGDPVNHRVRKVALSTGVISTVAGTGAQGFSGDGGAATSAQLNYPNGVAVDGSGNLFIADYGNDRVRKVVLSTGVISTVAGTGAFGFSGDGGAAVSAQLSAPSGVAVDGNGNLFIADRHNQRVRKVVGVAAIFGATSTSFNPTTLGLANIGASGTVTVATVGVPTGADGVQLNIQHSADVTIMSPACVGIFAGGSVIAPTAVSGGTSMGCLLLSGNVSGTTGSVMTFVVTRVGTGNPVLTFGLGVGFGTQFSDGGTHISPGTTNTLQIMTGGTTVSGTVTLQGRTATFPTGVGHGIATVTLSPGGATGSVNADGTFQVPNVPPGTFTLVASAAGYVSRQRTNVVVAANPVTLPSTQLRCGLVNNDLFVNINDITATVGAFGTAPAARVDAQGRFVDQNGDGFVNINDITCVVSGFGATSPESWP